MELQCPECGNPVSLTTVNCEKCDFAISSVFRDELWVVDVAHAGEDWMLARQKIESGLDSTLLYRNKGLKVIHGHGMNPGHSSKIKTRTIPFLIELASKHGGRVVPDRSNPGAHILYLN